MNNGGIEQIDTPENLYKHPKNRFVAEFIGEINLLKGVLMKSDSENATIQLSNGQIVMIKNRNQHFQSKSVLIALRPENIQLVEGDKNFKNTIQVKVLNVIYVGEALIVIVKTHEGEELKIKLPSLQAEAINVGKELTFGWNPQDATILEDEAGQNAALKTASSS
jgi:ABC-type Fe3+/spermidine/putrescine transport system ATPase subunit